MSRPDIDLRDLIGADVLDQGRRQTCVAFATSAAHEAARSEGGYAPEHLSPEAIWHYCHQHGLTGEDGMLLWSASSALGDSGQPLLSIWPYDSLIGSGTEEPPDGAGKPPWNQAELIAVHIAHDGIEDAIEDALAAKTPVAIILEITDEFLLATTEGLIEVPDIRANHGGYHAVTCVGAADHPTHGRLLLVKNSWGDEWGSGGYGWLPIGYLRAFGAQAATIRIRREATD